MSTIKLVWKWIREAFRYKTWAESANEEYLILIGESRSPLTEELSNHVIPPSRPYFFVLTENRTIH